MAKWVHSCDRAGDRWDAGEWRIRVDENGLFFIGGGGSNRFPTLADAKAWCQSQEDAAAPVELPKVGEVWGVPDTTTSFRRVEHVGEKSLNFAYFGGRSADTVQGWKTWLRESGAVRIDVEGERVAALEAEVARLRADVSRMQTACDIFEKNSEGAAALWEGLHKIAKMPHSNPTGDTLHGPCPKCIAEDTIKAVGSEPQNLSRVTVLEKERDDARAECARLAAVEEKREARAAVSRLMEALRGIEGHDGDACDHEDYGGCWKWVQKMAREAIAKEEGGGR